MKLDLYSERDFLEQDREIPDETDVLAYNFQLKRLIKACGEYARAKQRAQLSENYTEITKLGDLVKRRMDSFEKAEIHVGIIPETNRSLLHRLLDDVDRRRYYLRTINRNEIDSIRKIRPIVLVPTKELEQRYQRCLKNASKSSAVSLNHP
ncbi:hypothetical protein IKF76_00125 [Candidatus Saccharibacteria bacterium]|nr:hypothetical protein [Candidatus Saccharibacteria bacterium]